jgi:hypothetical protein
MNAPPKARLFKIGGAGLAYLPMLVLMFAAVTGFPMNHVVATGCAIFNFPAFSLLQLIQTGHPSHSVAVACGFALMFSWSSLIAWLFWQAVGTMQGEDEPEDQRGKFDWVRFQVRFFIGFILGFLMGWRFVAHTTSGTTVLIASIVTGIIGGFLFGLSRPPDFWNRT